MGNKTVDKPFRSFPAASTKKKPPDPWSALGVVVDKMVWNHCTASFDTNTFVYDDDGTLQPVAGMNRVTGLPSSGAVGMKVA